MAIESPVLLRKQTGIDDTVVMSQGLRFTLVALAAVLAIFLIGTFFVGPGDEACPDGYTYDTEMEGCYTEVTSGGDL